MNLIASKGQLRASFIRWALFTVPLIVLLGFLAGNLAGPNTSWFANLEKPSFYPDPMVFVIAWTILYVVMGVALAVVCSAWGARGRGPAIILFAVHFICNLAWTPIFFGMQNIELAFYVILAVTITLIAVIAAFWRVRRIAAVLMLPYLAWVIFASALNFQIMQLNPDGGNSILLDEQSQRYEI